MCVCASMHTCTCANTCSHMIVQMFTQTQASSLDSSLSYVWDGCYEEWTAETSLTYCAPEPVPDNAKYICVWTHMAPPSLHKMTTLCLSKSYTKYSKSKIKALSGRIKQLTLDLPYDTAIPLSHVYKTVSWYRNTCTCVFVTVLYTITRKEKQSLSPSWTND